MSPKHNRLPDFKKFDYLQQYLSLSNELRKVERCLLINTKKRQGISSDQHDISQSDRGQFANNDKLSNAIVDQLDELKNEISNIHKTNNFNLADPNSSR